MIVTETEIRTYEYSFAGKRNEYKWFEYLIIGKIVSGDPFQNHKPCWQKEKQ